MIRRELARFLIVGGLTVLVDFLSYRALVGLDVCSINVAKSISFLIGTIFAYFVNRFWTFGHKAHMPGSALRFSVLYTGTLGANVLVNALALKLLSNEIAAVQLAFLVATGVSACLNFLGMKFFVFRTRALMELP